MDIYMEAKAVAQKIKECQKVLTGSCKKRYYGQCQTQAFWGFSLITLYLQWL